MVTVALDVFSSNVHFLLPFHCTKWWVLSRKMLRLVTFFEQWIPEQLLRRKFGSLLNFEIFMVILVLFLEKTAQFYAEMHRKCLDDFFCFLKIIFDLEKTFPIFVLWRDKNSTQTKKGGTVRTFHRDMVANWPDYNRARFASTLHTSVLHKALSLCLGNLWRVMESSDKHHPTTSTTQDRNKTPSTSTSTQNLPRSSTAAAIFDTTV